MLLKKIKIIKGLLISVCLFWHAFALAVPQVIATIAPVNALVGAVTEGVTSPTMLIDPFASPHHYQLKPSDVTALSEADVIVWVGPELETFLSKMLDNVPSNDATIVTIIDEPDLKILSQNGHVDPHIWLLPENAAIIVNTIARTLCERDAEHCETYQTNAQQAVEQITLLDETLADKLAPVHTKPYLVLHDAYRYFEQHYHLNNRGAVTLTPERQISAKHLATLQQQIEEEDIICIFTEPQLPSQIVEMLVRTTPIKQDELDPIGIDITPDLNGYERLLTKLADNIARCLT